ncbi:Citrate lyase alpha chain (EC [Olavius sp. associated proteobacterium Delta 1]|nr:Citrate lyase alpha chain (EC [Olavius sp. associated proteobacterium Delta 1]
MPSVKSGRWEHLVVTPRRVLASIKPGMTIFFGSGVAEPRTLMKCLIESGLSNTNDLELVQLTSHGDVLSLKDLDFQNYRLKTFFSTWVASEVVFAGSVDLIPGRISQIPQIIKSRRIPIDVAFIQITPPNEDGYCSLGVAVDIAREAMEQASLVVGEINTEIPFTFGDTIVSISDFDLLVKSIEPPGYFKRQSVSKAIDKVAANISQVIEDGDCICFHTGPLFEALGRHLATKRHLGIHSAYFTDALMDLVKSGAVTNYRKSVMRGKSAASYALGTPELMAWLDHNPLVEFQGIEQLFDPIQIGRNANFVAVFEARKVDLLGRVSFSVGKTNITSGPGEGADLFTGAEISPGGRTILGLPSRNRKGDPNIVAVLRDLRNQYHMRESIDVLVTEYGIANLKWRTIRERAQALIDIAHPNDREKLVEKAKQKKLLFPDQIFLSESAQLYPMDIATEHIFKNGLKIRFRAIKPSDEAAMRRLFYRFSNQTVFRRFLFPISTMPHNKMQEYVNVDYSRMMSVVALARESDQETIIAEARYVKDEQSAIGDLAFVVDEKYQGIGIGSYLYKMLIRLAKDRGLKGFSAEVLQANQSMMKVFENGQLPINARVDSGLLRLTVSFDGQPDQAGNQPAQIYQQKPHRPKEGY